MVESLGGGRYLVPAGSGTQARLAYAVADGPRRWVFIDGRTFVFDPSNADASAERDRDDSGQLASPIPATVVAVQVIPGQLVQKGDTVVMLEAMKMELPIVAPRAGRVTTVRCHQGELVQAGVALLEIEPAIRDGSRLDEG